MKRSSLHILSTSLVLLFLVVTTLATVCLYHHGIDGMDQRQQGGVHSTLFCPSFSKVSGLSLVIASGLGDFHLQGLRAEPFQSDILLSPLFVQKRQARSPPFEVPS